MLERDREVATLEALVAAAAGGDGAAAVIEGPAGIGKSSLLASAADLARRAGLAVLSARATELEGDLPWLVVRELFEPALRTADEPDGVLAGAAALAGPIFGRGESGPSADTASVLHGLYWLAANLGEHAPLLLTVDDIHWADPPSVRWLAYLAARIVDLPILLLVSVRAGGEAPSLGLVAMLRHATRTLRPAALSGAAVTELVRARLGEEAEDGFCDACLTATNGNPFLVRALTDECAEESMAPTAANAERVGKIRPVTVTRTILLRLARVPPEARRLATAAAVLGAEVRLRDAAALAELDQVTAAPLADVLADAAILAPALPLRFVHPIVRTVIHESLPAAERDGWHARAARQLGRRGAQPDAVAIHLLNCEPAGDPVAVGALRAAAAHALGRGVPETAVRCLRRALAEGAADDLEAGILFELGEAETRLADPEAATHLERALTLAADPRQRARCALLLGPLRARVGRVCDGVDLLDDARAGLGESDRELSLLLEAEAMACAREDFATSGSIPNRLAQLPELEGATCAELLVLANAAMQSAMSGDSAERTVKLAHRALAHGRLFAVTTAESAARFLPIHALIAADRAEEALRYLEEALAHVRERGSPVGLAVTSICRSHAHCCAGALPNAIADARLALDFALQAGWTPMVPWALAFLIDALVEAGQLAEARSELQASGLTGPLADAPFYEPLASARARLALAEGDAEVALEAAHLGRRLAAAGSPGPAMSPWRSLTGLALARLGREEEANELIAEELALARRYGAPRPIANALLAAARLAAGEERLDLLREAVAILEDSTARLTRARALVELGGALRRGGARVDARDPLRRGLELATQCGAHALAARAREELVATGARPRRAELTGPDALTPSELRVAEMAARDASNREIAEGLFVSLRTVEAHLTRAYQKLGIASRAELPAALSPPPASSRPSPAAAGLGS